MDDGRRTVLIDRRAVARAEAAAAPGAKRPTLVIGLGAIAAIAVIIVVGRRPGRLPTLAVEPPGRSVPQVAAGRLDRASALLAASALADSAIEHYRGSFHNKFMYVPLAVSVLTLGSSICDAARGASIRRLPRPVVNGAAVATGIVGTGFHLYNITKRPGGSSWLNLFYAAPLGAPAALSLAGLLGSAGHLVRGDNSSASGPLLAGLVAAGLLGTTGEAALLHFRGAYHNPAMLIPITAGPTAAALLARAALAPHRRPAAARWLLRLLAGIGFAGAGFHAYGVQRNMGGWRNWSQNLLNGPPLPAPPAFTALALAGLAALGLIEGQHP